MKNKYTYASVVPLIGGETLGIMETLNGQLPEYMLSYTPFKNNDSHFVSYLREKHNWKGDYVFIDEETYTPKIAVDVVNTVCPCAGLSSLSVSSSPDNELNEWMYHTAEYVLQHLSPKVFWGENAPRLSSPAGGKVARRLHEIGLKYGYSLNLYYTESRIHGLSQKRPRTFYFFTKDPETAPLFDYFHRETEPVENILRKAVEKDDPMNILINKAKPLENAWIAYCAHKLGAKTTLELYEKIDKTRNCIRFSDELSENLNDVADWMDANGFDEKFGKRARNMQLKVEDNKGYWAHGVTIPKGIIPSLIAGLPTGLINPFNDSYLTIRDCFRIMKMPDDFNLLGENPLSNLNHICQNVPVTTAADMMKTVVNYLDSNLDSVRASFVKQNNAKRKHEILSSSVEVEEIDRFFV